MASAQKSMRCERSGWDLNIVSSMLWVVDNALGDRKYAHYSTRKNGVKL